MEDYNQGIIPAVIQNHEAVASHYHLPTLNLALEGTTRINRGQFTWENDFKDLHPSPFGHQIYFNSIKRLFEAAWPNKLGEKEAIKPHHQPNKLDQFCYGVGMLLSPDRVEKTNGFKLDPNWQIRWAVTPDLDSLMYLCWWCSWPETALSLVLTAA